MATQTSLMAQQIRIQLWADRLRKGQSLLWKHVS